MTTAERNAVRILRLARCLENGDTVTAREIVELVPLTMVFESTGMVRSILIDPTKRGEFARATASRLLKIQSEIRADPIGGISKYFPR